VVRADHARISDVGFVADSKEDEMESGQVRIGRTTTPCVPLARFVSDESMQTLTSEELPWYGTPVVLHVLTNGGTVQVTVRVVECKPAATGTYAIKGFVAEAPFDARVAEWLGCGRPITGYLATTEDYPIPGSLSPAVAMATSA